MLEFIRRAPVAVATASLLSFALAGCKSGTSPGNDAALTTSIQGVLTADNAIAGQPVQVAVQNGVATLSGSVANDAQRTLAARDVAGVAGVTKVVNEIGVNNASASVATPAPAPLSLAPAERSRTLVNSTPREARQPAPVERLQPPYNPPRSQPSYTPPPQQAQAPPPPPPQPNFRMITIASGNTIPVRITETLDSASTQPGTPFSGVVASDIVIDGVVAIPAGAAVSGHVDDVKDATHFKGSSALTVSLTSITRRGEHIAVTSDPYTVEGKGRGTNTAEKTGGGAAVGAILGGIFGGGKGAAIGAAAGAGAGAGSNAITRGQQVQIASESVVRFHLSNALTVRVRSDGDRRDDNGLQPR